MMATLAARLGENITRTMVTRLLIVSYFIALGLGLITGSELWRLTAPVLPEALAAPVASALVIALATCVMVGVYRRASALVLAMVVFWASYLAMMASAEDVGAFWRDLALISGLLMSAGIGGQPTSDDARRERAKRPAPQPRAERQPAPHQINARPRTRSVQERFRQDLDLAGLS